MPCQAFAMRAAQRAGPAAGVHPTGSDEPEVHLQWPVLTIRTLDDFTSGTMPRAACEVSGWFGLRCVRKRI